MQRQKTAVIALIISSLLLACPQEAPVDPTAAWDHSHDAAELVIDFKDNVDADDIAEIEKKFGIDIEFNSIHSKDDVLTIARVPKADMKRIAKALMDTGLVESVEPNYSYSVFQMEPEDTEGFVPNDPDYGKQWHLRNIGVQSAWEHARGSGVVVAVIDTGVAYERHQKFLPAPDLMGTKFVPGYNFVNDTEHANDDHGHGTHVTGTIAQTTNNGIGVAGIAFEASIMPIKVLSKSGQGSVADIADAIRFAADEGAHVINMSLGGPMPSLTLQSAVRYARDKGVVIVCAAGNSGRRGVGYPAAYEGAIAVSAIGPKGALAPYSSYGKQVMIAAPGGDKSLGEKWGVLQNVIVRGKPAEFEYAFYQGTSMASPHVAGVAALIIGSGVTRAADVERILIESAKRPNGQDETKRDERYGYGIVDAAAAVTAARDGVSGVSTALFTIGMALSFFGFILKKPERSALANMRFLLGLTLGGCGIFFLDDLIGTNLMSEILGRSVLMWDFSVFGIGGYATPLWHSALIPILACALCAASNTWRPIAIGFTLGAAALLGHGAILGVADIQWIPNWWQGTFDTIWLLGNSLIAYFVAGIMARALR